MSGPERREVENAEASLISAPNGTRRMGRPPPGLLVLGIPSAYRQKYYSTTCSTICSTEPNPDAIYALFEESVRVESPIALCCDGDEDSDDKVSCAHFFVCRSQLSGSAFSLPCLSSMLYVLSIFPDMLHERKRGRLKLNGPSPCRSLDNYFLSAAW